MCLTIDPSSRYRLQRVIFFFCSIVNKVPLPVLYIPYALMPVVPNPVSVRRLLTVAGRNSSLMMEVRLIINNSRWANAWLHLNEMDHAWYQTRNIWWRRV